MTATDVPAKDDTDQAEHGTVFTFRAHLRDKALANIEKVNRRLARGGTDEKFTFTEESIVKTETVDGVEGEYAYITLTLNAPTIRANGFTFVAALTQEEGGMIVRAKPGESLENWKRPEDHWCDYCKTKRNRSTSYVVRNEETGEFLQIGKNCVAPFFGMSPNGLWALTYDPSELIPEDDGPRGGGRSHVDRLFSIDELLRTAWAVSNGGRDFVTAGTARDYDMTSTASEAMNVITWSPMGREAYKMQAIIDAKRAQAAAVPAEVVAELIAVGRGLEGNSDYVQNMQVALNSERVSYRSASLVISLIATYNRQKQIHAEKEARRRQQDAIVDGWLGEPKEKIGGFNVTVTRAMEVDGYAYNSTDTIVIMQSDEGYVLKWKASGVHDEIDTGRRFHVERATVKDHGEYRDVKQTIVTRCKLIPLDAEEDGDDQTDDAADATVPSDAKATVEEVPEETPPQMNPEWRVHRVDNGTATHSYCYRDPKGSVHLKRGDAGSWRNVGSVEFPQGARVVTKAEAKAFAEANETCLACNKPISDVRSKARGYGPTCAAKFA